jgi:hypothetical protein
VQLCATPHTLTEQAVSGEWELVYSQVELFRSSPFFLAVEEALGKRWKSDLFFKLHQLQVWIPELQGALFVHQVCTAPSRGKSTIWSPKRPLLERRLGRAIPGSPS